MVMVLIALPVMAQQSRLSPQEVEALPFDTSRAGAPNAQTIYEQIDTDVIAHNAVNAKSDAGLPQFDTSTFASQLFWLAITFFILYTYFSRVALPRISATIEQRHATIKGDLEQADKLSNKIDATREQYESAISNAHNNARSTIAEMEQSIRADADVQSREFALTSSAAVTDLEAKADKAKQKIKSDLNAIAETLTADIIAKLTPLSVKEDDIRKAVSENSGIPANNNQKKAA
jgi:F-type H+-transporting ATPase subunit b